MTSLEFESARPDGRGSTTSAGLLTLTFAGTLFLSAFLLFSVQPMFTKMVLPVLGGSPGVWSVAMIFFQALLLGGYLWAHVLTSYLPLRIATTLHIALTAGAMLALPVALGKAAAMPPESGEAMWLIGIFASAVGLPFFALSANGPLLQAWFARSGHPRAENPYALYGASNIGSFGALLAYPFMFEPFMGLSHQSRLWSAGYVALLLCLCVCSILTLRGARADDAAAIPAVRIRRDWGWKRFALWTLLATIPSGLLVSVTAHISTDIAAAPLLWVLPLALYLLTFVMAFRDRFAIDSPNIVPVQVFATLLMFALMAMSGVSLMVALILHLTFFFVSVLLCHRTLYELRPSHLGLTSFYVAMSLGGVIGGLFAGLVAPNIFSNVLEYPLLIAAILFCQPRFAAELRTEHWRAFAMPVAVAIAIVTLTWFAATHLLPAPRAIAFGSALLFCAAILRWRSAPHVALYVGAMCVATIWLPHNLSNSQSWRSFFGVHKVRELAHEGERFRVLMHGTTMHGAVRIDHAAKPFPKENPLPTTYYAFEGPIGEAIASARTAQGRLSTIHAIGLGIGTLSCHRKADEKITFFEIDPEVIRLARDPLLFNFVSACAPDARIVTGDARLTLTRENEPANVMVIDAFSSDAIPIHLMTREAMAIYLSKLDPNGVLVFHISNNTMDLTQTVARVAAQFGLVAYRRVDVIPGVADANMRTSSIAMAVARDASHLGPIAQSDSWKKIEADLMKPYWTDDYSTILEPILAYRK